MTLVILSVLAAIGLPGLSGLTSKKALYHQADDFCALFSRAREQALEDGCSWRITISPGQGRWVCFRDSNNNTREDPGEEKMGPYSLESGVLFGCLLPYGPNNTTVPPNGVSFVADRVNFSPMGSCNAGTLYLRGGKRVLALRVLPASGMVRTYEYTDGWKVLR